jgi:hypothetical protein
MKRFAITPLPKRWLAALCLSLLAVAAAAAPGAHGPDGEHLDGKLQPASGASSPRVEAHSELFELVANLKPGELSILIDRYESNEPVLGAQLEVESGSLKAVAAYRADQGDYLVTDAALLKALAAPGEHALVFTLVAGQDSDLLDATLRIGSAVAAGGDAGHSHGDGQLHDHELERAAWIGAAVLGLGLLGLVAWLRQRKREAVVAARGTTA